MTFPGLGPQDRATRCPSCGGLNPAGAQWCGQCLVSFQEPARATEPEMADDSVSGFFDPLTAPQDSLPFDRKVEPRGAFVVAGNDILWTCSACRNENPLRAMSCEACGSSFADTVAQVDSPKGARDPRTAALYSLLFPGAGYFYLGLVGQGIGRAVMSIWVTLVAAVALLSGGGGPSLFLWTSFGLAAVSLWLATAHDSYMEASGRSGLIFLTGRRSLYVTLALVAVLFCVMTFGELEARGSGI